MTKTVGLEKCSERTLFLHNILSCWACVTGCLRSLQEATRHVTRSDDTVCELSSAFPWENRAQTNNVQSQSFWQFVKKKVLKFLFLGWIITSRTRRYTHFTWVSRSWTFFFLPPFVSHWNTSKQHYVLPLNNSFKNILMLQSFDWERMVTVTTTPTPSLVSALCNFSERVGSQC